MTRKQKPQKLRQFVIGLIYSLMLLMLSSEKSHAQYDPIADADSQLREFFSPLCVPDTGRFLYEMAAHVLDKSFFSDNSTDTLTVDSWFKLYEEFRHMAYDTSWILRHDTVYYRATDYTKDTIMVTMMNYYYYTLHDSALTTDTFFNFDTTNFTISDKHPCELYPYINNRVFAASPVQYYLPYKEVTYRIDDDFIFRDQWHDIVSNGWLIEIDFGDGAGWQNIPGPNPGSPFHYVATYTNAGTAYIKTRIFDPISNTYIMSSIAEVMVPNRVRPPEPSYKIPRDGAVLGVYAPCEQSGEPLEKIIFVVEGYDFQNNRIGGNRGIADIFGSMVQAPGLEDLRNFGYTFVVVDWNNAKRDIKDNASTLVGVLDFFKCQQMLTSDTGTHEQFVIIAESMGGLVARYALCDMEQNWTTLNGCLDEKMHNTRLLITYDSPHDGVNIPLAYQHLYRDAGKYILHAPTITQNVMGAYSNALLDGKAVKQMLLYHVDTRHHITHEYFEHPDRTAFKAALNNLGNYPQLCKMVALSNGSIQGNGQTNVMNGNPRIPNDDFIDWETDVFAQILGQTIQIAGTNTELKSSPNGSGNLAVFHKNAYRLRIRFNTQLVWRPFPWPPRLRVTMNVTGTYFFSTGITYHANNLEPYDVVPGSIEPTAANNFVGNDGDMTDMARSMFFGSRANMPVFDPGSGTWNFRLNGPTLRGINGIGGFINASFGSDGEHFCFVPTFSALDYNLGTDYWRNIENVNIATKTHSAVNPFDVIIGEVAELQDNVRRFSRGHQSVRNEFLESWYDGEPVPDRQQYEICEGDNPHPVNVRMLNREIGDDTLWINNRVVAWTCIYDAEKYIGVTEQNPYYEHPNFVTSFAIPGVYSKEDNFNSINGTTMFLVRSDTNNIVFDAPPSYSYTKDTIDWVKCCNTDFPHFKPGKPLLNSTPKSKISEENVDIFTVYPNPVSGNILNLTFTSKQQSRGSIMLYDVMGRRIWEQEYSTGSKLERLNYKIDLNKSKIASGIYFVILSNNGSMYKQSIIIQ